MITSLLWIGSYGGVVVVLLLGLVFKGSLVALLWIACFVGIAVDVGFEPL